MVELRNEDNDYRNLRQWRRAPVRPLLLLSGPTQMTESYDLKPCPHCGQAVEMRPQDGARPYLITCPGCPWVVEVTEPHPVQTVVDAWNRRD